MDSFKVVFDLRTGEPGCVYSDVPDDLDVIIFLDNGKILRPEHIEDIGNLPAVLDMKLTELESQ